MDRGDQQSRGDVSERFGEYRLVERLAVEPFSEVFRATTTGIGGFEKTLVIKRLDERLGRDQAFVETLVDDARLAVQLDHPNIAQVFDLGRVEGRYYIAREYVRGPDLGRVVQRLTERGERMPLPAALFIGAECCSGLHYAHTRTDETGRRQGIVHGDVTTENIMLSAEGEVKVADFGITEAWERLQRPESEGPPEAKLRKMAPERAAGLTINARTDVFSVGMVIYELVAGRSPYADLSGPELGRAVRRAEIPSLRQYRPETDPELERIVMRALRPNSDDRYQSAADFERALTDYRERKTSPYDRRRLAELVGGTSGDDSAAKLGGAEPEEQTGRMAPDEFEADESSIIHGAEELQERTEGGFGEGAARVEEHGDDEVTKIWRPDDTGGGARSSRGGGAGRPMETRESDGGPGADVSVPESGRPIGSERESARPGARSTGSAQRPGQAGAERSGADHRSTGDRRPRAQPEETGAGAVPQSGGHAGRGAENEVDSMEPPGVGDGALPPPPEEGEEAFQPKSPHGEEVGTEPSSSGGSNERERRPPEVEPGEGRPRSEAKRTSRPDEGDTAPGDRMSVATLVARLERAGIDRRTQGIAAAVAAVMMVSLVGLVALVLWPETKQTFDSSDRSEGKAASSEPGEASLRVRSDPPGATVRLDEEKRGETPVDLEGLKGDETYRVEVERDGYRGKSRNVRPSEQSKPLEFSLERSKGVLKVSTDPAGAEIEVNGEKIGYAPVRAEGLHRDEAHDVRATLDGETVTEEVEWEEMDEAVQEVDLELEVGSGGGAAPGRESRGTRGRRAPERGTAGADRVGTKGRSEDGDPGSSEASGEELDLFDDSESESGASGGERGKVAAREEAGAGDDGGEGSGGDSAELDIWGTEGADESGESGSSEESAEQEGGRSGSAGGRADGSKEEAFLSVQVKKGWGKVFVDGKEVASETPLVNHSLSPGTHEVKVYYPVLKRASEVRTVRVESGETKRVLFDP